MSCPKCGCHIIDKGPIGGQDFDENGWYNLQPFYCKDPNCMHEWNEKIILLKGGTLLSHHHHH